jgi:hypothetical protein
MEAAAAATLSVVQPNATKCRMQKPELPPTIACKFPPDVLQLIYSFVPRLLKPKSTPVSPALEKDLRRIQARALAGKSEMYLRDLEDFLL